MKNINAIILVCLLFQVSAFGQPNSFKQFFAEYIELDDFHFAEVTGDIFVLEKTEADGKKEAKIDKVQILSVKDTLTQGLNLKSDAENYLEQFSQISYNEHDNKKMMCHAAYKNGNITQLIILLESGAKIMLISIEGAIDKSLIDQIKSPKGIHIFENLSVS